MSRRTIIDKMVTECPACQKPISARLTVDIDVESIPEGSQINMTGTIVGAQISHDCTPQVTR